MKLPHSKVMTLLVVAGCLWVSKVAFAADDAAPAATASSETRKAEAAHRFDRALKLFEAGDNAGALAEFKRTYEIFPDPMVLYNMGLVYAAMGRPVDAVDALEPLVQKGTLAPAQLDRARQTLLDQQARIGRLVVATRPETTRIEVDGVEVASTPRSTPIRISEGKHIIGAVAEGFAPARKELFIAGNADASIELELVPTQVQQPANLAIVSRLRGVEVLVDGKSVGQTPLATSVSVNAGKHVVELRRSGYVSARREVEVGAGAMSEIAAELLVDAPNLGIEGATLVLEATESPVDVVIDGERKGQYTAPIRLPRGPHHILVSAAGFVPSERDVELSGSVSNVVRFVLEPTAETRKAHESAVRSHRTWGWLGVVSGAVIAGGGTALAIVGQSKKSDAQGDLDATNAKYTANEAPCDWRDAFKDEDKLPPGQQGSYLCDKTRADARARINDAKTLATIGFVGIGVGAGVAVTGLVLLLTGPDANRYTREGKPTATLRAPTWAITPGPGEIGTGLRVSF